ncbi:MAG TPA: nucleotide exchange factor GrpE [Alphaproteobacteria bacterium]|nr:nucleotide exchange factor GrpE [Alphaproteobacteria bacterium]
MSNEPKPQEEHEAPEGSFAEQIEADEALESALNAAESAPDQAPAPENNSAALAEELAAAKDQTLRALAELENYRRRAQKEREDAGKYAVSSFARDLLNVSDNLRRAIEAFPEDAKQDIRVANLIEGIEATEKELLRSFEKHGIQKIEPMDVPFDPNFHEVMFEASVPGKPSGTVIQVIEAGYVLNDRLLRPARVGVSKSEGSAGAAAHPGGNLDTEA